MVRAPQTGHPTPTPSTPPHGSGQPAARRPSLEEVAAEARRTFDRNALGRFTKGNCGGPGNPHARRIAAFRRAVLNAVTEEDLQAITHKLIAQARDGDVAAARLLFAYALGKPTAVNPDTLDVEEWKLHQQLMVMPDEIERAFGLMPLELILAGLRAALPELGKAKARQLHGLLMGTLTPEQVARGVVPPSIPPSSPPPAAAGGTPTPTPPAPPAPAAAAAAAPPPCTPEALDALLPRPQAGQAGRRRAGQARTAGPEAAAEGPPTVRGPGAGEREERIAQLAARLQQVWSLTPEGERAQVLQVLGVPPSAAPLANGDNGDAAEALDRG